MKIVDRLGRYDGLDLANLAGVELLFRRLQLIEYFWSEKGPGGGKAGGKGSKDKSQTICRIVQKLLYSVELIANTAM